MPTELPPAIPVTPPPAAAPAPEPEPKAPGFTDSGAPPATDPGDPDPLKPQKFAVGEPTFEEKLRELQNRLANEKVDVVKARVEPASSVKTDRVTEIEKAPELVKAPVAADIADDTTDTDLDKHIKDSTKGLTSLQREAFKKQTYEIRDYKRQLKDKVQLESRLKELEEKGSHTAADAVQKKLDEVQKRMEEQERELAGSRLEATLEFRQKIAEPMQDIEAKFKQAAADYELDPAAVLAASNLKGKARAAAMAELTVEMPAYDQAKFYQLVDRHTELADQAKEMRANAKVHYDQMIQQQREQRDQEAAQHRSQYSAAVEKTWQESIVANAPYIKEDPANPDWNERLDYSRKWAASVNLNELPPETVAEVTNRAATWPLLAGKVHELEAENQKLQQRIASLKKASPSSGNGRIAATPQPSVDDNDNLEQRFKKFRSSIGIG